MFAAAPPGLSQVAAMLAPRVHGADADQVESFLRVALGDRGGSGLRVVVEGSDAAAQVFGAAFALDALSSLAAVNRANCSKLAALGRDVIIILDAAGRKGASVDPTMLSALAACFDDCCALVDSFSQTGWLLRVACDEQLREEFVTMHEAVQEILKSDNLAQLPGGRDMPAADYANLHKVVRRTLKQLGRGDVTAGVLAARDADSGAAKELAAQLEVKPSQVAAEARRVPESGLGIDALFRSLLQAASPGFPGSGLPGGAGGNAPGAGGDQAEDFRRLFEWYDADKSGAIELPELQRVLSDLGLLEGKAAREVAACVEANMRAADEAGEGVLSLEAFSRWYATLGVSHARQQLRSKMGLQAEDDLRSVFAAFSSFGAREAAARDMDGAALIKMVRDAGLLGGGLTPTAVDLVFAKVKSKGVRRITFDQFLSALCDFADKKGTSFEEVAARVLQAGGPVATATKADAVRLHDDRSQYTGVHKRGGPTAVDDVFDLAAFLDRDKSAAAANAAAPGAPGAGAAACRDRRVSTAGRSPGLPVSRVVTPAASRRTSTGPTTPGLSAAPTAANSRRVSHSGDDAALSGPAPLQDVFASFARFGIHDRDAGGARAAAAATPPVRRFQTFAATPDSVGKGPATLGAVQMDGFRFAKLCREAGLVDGKKLSLTSVDLIFTKAKAKGAKKIGFDEFRRALQMVADAKGCALDAVASAVEGCGGPAIGSATTPDAVRFHDDARRTPAAAGAGGGGRDC